jgi:hypothetical protein
MPMTTGRNKESRTDTFRAAEPADQLAAMAGGSTEQDPPYEDSEV